MKHTPVDDLKYQANIFMPLGSISLNIVNKMVIFENTMKKFSET